MATPVSSMTQTPRVSLTDVFHPHLRPQPSDFVLQLSDFVRLVHGVGEVALRKHLLILQKSRREVLSINRLGYIYIVYTSVPSNFE